MHEPWSFEDGPEAAARIQREYGRTLAVNLPRLPPGTQRTPALTDGYRLLTRAALQASRDYQAARIAGHSRDTADLGRRAQALRAALEVLHRHLVALEQSELLHGFLVRTPEAAALEAERNVEALAERVELGAKGR